MGHGEQFGSPARHLLARYDAPAFLVAAWFAGPTPDGVRQQRWFKHGGRKGVRSEWHSDNLTHDRVGV